MEKYIYDSAFTDNDLFDLDNLVSNILEKFDNLEKFEQNSRDHWLICTDNFENVLDAKSVNDTENEQQQWDIVENFIKKHIKQFEIAPIEILCDNLLRSSSKNVGKVEKMQATKTLYEYLNDGTDILNNIEYQISLLKDYIEYSNEYIADSENAEATLTVLDFWESVLEAVLQQL